ncbi:MAG: alpha-2-macroglobulin [Alphaproteobacteria bacterium]|nr:alpha-2-macroglobulin [Alphaproteobacteria bacterium]
MAKFDKIKNSIKSIVVKLKSKFNKVSFKKVFTSGKDYVKANKKKSIAFFVLFVVLLMSVLAYLLRDKGYSVSETAEKTTVSNIYLYNPDDSYVSGNQIIPGYAKIYYPYPVAHLEKIYKVVESGIRIHPDISGTWRWTDSQNLTFTPAKDWIPNTEYKVKLSNEIFSDSVDVEKSAREFSISSPTFSGRTVSSEFYEDPRDIKVKQVVASFKFNYPIATDNLDKVIKIKTYGGDNYEFTYKLKEKDTVLHVLSAPVKIKQEEDFAEIQISGIKNAYNQEKLKSDLKTKVKIPSSKTFFKLNSFNSQIIRNELKNNEPEQVMFVNFSTAVEAKELAEYVEFYTYDTGCYNISSKLSKVTYPTEIKNVKKLEVEALSTDSSKTHMFKYDIVKRNACVITRIKKGLSSVDGFLFSDDEIKYTSSSNYPMSANIAFQGSILSLKGDKTLTLSSQGVDNIKVEVARIASNDLNHLISQTSGDFTNPYFRNYSFTEDNISEIFRKELPINMKHPAKTNYASVNLNEYFKSKKGTFLVTVKGKHQSSWTSEEKRLVVITDLALMVKDNLDKTHDVFVSSFAEGRPIEGAKVELLGLNGVPVLTAYTSASGMAKIHDYSDFRDEKRPTVYVVSQGGDLSFMPVDRSDRKLDLSKFDIGGVYDSTSSNEMKAYGFSDRGIYRPNEKASFGVMLRNKDLVAPTKYPLKLTVVNPSGEVVATKAVVVNEFGMLDYQYNVPASARIGDYSLNIYDVSGRYEKYLNSVAFRVEEFMPDTMKIKLTLQDVQKKGWYIESKIKGKTLLQNLYGNPAIGHRVKATFTLQPTGFSFAEYKGYNFQDPLKTGTSRSYYETLEEETTSKKGEADFEVDLNAFSRGTYQFALNVEGFELEGGRSVFTSQKALVSPAKYLVGYKADGGLRNIAKNTERNINFLAIDNTLNKIAKENLTLKVVQIKYVPSLVEMENGTFKYMQIAKEETLSENKVSIPATGNKYEVNTETSGQFYLLLEDEAGEVVSKVSYDIAGGENTNFMLDRDAALKVTLNKKQYNNGEMISMKIISPYEGYGLITIERDSVYAYKWFKTSSKVTTEDIRLPNTVEGNAYVNVSFVRDSNSREIFMPPLAYAVEAFEINKDKRDIKIELEMPEKVKPGEDLVVKYKAAKSGKVIVYGVNQGILQVAKYQLPNPLSEFIKKKALRVQSSQIMDLIMPDMRLLQLNKATGGDIEYSSEELQKQVNPFARKQEEVVAFWSGVIDVTTENQEYVYRVPSIFNGQIKVMAVAVSESAMGSVSADTYVRGDFALTPNGPFNVSPHDEFEVGTSIANLVEGSGKNYEVKVTLNASNGLEVLGETTQTLKIDENGEKSVRYKIRALPELGGHSLVYTVEAANESDKHFEMSYHIGVRPASPYVTSLSMGQEPKQLTLKNFVTPMYDEYRRQEAFASTSPLVLSEGLIAFLDKFPHACTEQTISKIYPAMDIFFKYPDLVKGIDIYGLYDDALAKLMERQKSGGGFAAWSGGWSSVDKEASLYAFDFLTFAKEKNFDVPTGMYNKVTTYAKSVAGETPSGLNDSKVAYAIFLLTQKGEVTTNYLINLEKYYEELAEASQEKWKDKLKRLTKSKEEWKGSLSAAYMAASYKMLKNDTKARGLIGDYDFDKNSDLDNARYITVMSKFFAEDLAEIDAKAVKSLLKPLKAARFNTSLSANSLLALSSYKFDKKADKKIEFVDKPASYETFARTIFSEADKTLTIKSPQAFFYVLSEQGFEKESAKKAKSNFLELSKEFLNEKGNTVSKANVGDELTVRIRFKTTGNKDYVNDVAIVDLIAGCFEVVSNSIETDASLDYKEEREDRALIYLSANSQVQEITYKVKVIAKGKFVVPATYAEALYDTDVRANTKNSTFTVEE